MTKAILIGLMASLTVSVSHAQDILGCEGVYYNSKASAENIRNPVRFDVTAPNQNLIQQDLVEKNGTKIRFSSYAEGFGLYLIQGTKEVANASTYYEGNKPGSGGYGKLSLYHNMDNGGLLYVVCDFVK